MKNFKAIAAAAGTIYVSAVSMVNLHPEGFGYVPVLSQATPILAQVTRLGGTRTEIISHADFTSINTQRAAVNEALEEFNETMSRTIAELEQLEQELETTISYPY